MRSNLTSNAVALLFSLVAAACGAPTEEASTDDAELVTEGVLTYENFLTHPRVLEVDRAVAASAASAGETAARFETKGASSPEGSTVCELVRRLDLDAEGRLRRAERTIGSRSVTMTSTRTFDETGALRYVRNVGARTFRDGTTHHEVRGYFNGRGELFFEAHRSAPSVEELASAEFGPPPANDSFWTLVDRDYPVDAAATRTWFDSEIICR